MNQKLRELKRQQMALRQRIEKEQKEMMLDAFDVQERENGPGLTIKELCGQVLGKKYVGEKDLRKIRPVLMSLRKEVEDLHAIVCLGNRYRYARDEDEVRRYNEGTMENGLKKVAAGAMRLPKHLVAVGADPENAQQIIRALLVDFQLTTTNRLALEHKVEDAK